MRVLTLAPEKTLLQELERLARDHDYTKRYEKALAKIPKNKMKKGAKKSSRALAMKTTRALGGKATIRRAELVQHLQAEGYSEPEADVMLKKLHASGLLKCTVGKFSEAYVALRHVATNSRSRLK
jgi:dTDP-4-amino-4,6-dideoxygalactose transaminase